MNKQKNIPLLRFPEFTEEWIASKLGDVCEINPSNKSLPEKFIYIDLESVANGKLLQENEVIKQSAPSRAQRVLKENDVLFQMVRPYQMNNLYFDKKGDYVASTGYAQLRTELNSKFIFQYLHYQKFVDKVINRCTGTSYPAINSSDLSKIIIHYPLSTIPSVSEQKKIANFLTAVDEKLQALKQKKSLLEKYKKGVMQQIFSQQIRFKPALSEVEGDENGKEFPKWEEKRLGEVGKTYGGLSGKSKENFGIGKPYIQYKQIFDNSKIDILKYELVDIKENENQNKVQFGDVFFTISSETPEEIGMSSVLLDDVQELYLNSFCFGFRVNSLKEVNPYFSRYLFRNDIFREEIIKLAQGSTRYNMSKVQFIKIKIQIPSLSEQIKIANFLSSIDERIHNSQLSIIHLEKWKKGLLQKMFV